MSENLDQEIIDSIERWAERELKPIAKKFDHADEYPQEIVEQMKELGLFGATILPEYGGRQSESSTRISSWRRAFNGTEPKSKRKSGCRDLPAATFAEASGSRSPTRAPICKRFVRSRDARAITM
jgi:alkylation response protein AidB-like acyl-CoA dehydrogenase